MFYSTNQILFDKQYLILNHFYFTHIDTFAQTAWVNSTKNPKLDIEIIEAMKKGSILVAEGTSVRGTDTKDTYSLIGFSKALKKLKDVCK